VSKNRPQALQVETPQRNARSGFRWKIKQSVFVKIVFPFYSAHWMEGPAGAFSRLPMARRMLSYKK
jgi:hypothetical protein